MTVTRRSLPSRVATTRENVARPKGCRNKVRYPKRKQALGARNGLIASNPDDPRNVLLEVYRCPHGCHGWHVGHSSRRAA